ncbi:hypothetical protein V6Z12_A05G105900 [Gossypium hirsutum]
MMAIEKNNFKVSRFDSEFSYGSRETTVSSDEDELQRQSSAVDSDGDDDDDDEFDDADSGAGSDDFDLLELGETGAEFCQVGNLTCSVPFELYDLPGLEDILSLDVWNECLSDEERFSLTKFLPDVDQDTFMRTLNDLLKGDNFHFGSPIKKLFDMLKGGLCEPRVALYREGLNFFQKRQHYHHLRKHQNNMVANLCQIRDAWLKCRGYGIEERLRVLNIMRSQKSLMYDKFKDEDSESSKREDLNDGLWSKKEKDRKASQKKARYSGYGVEPNLEFISRGQLMALEPAKYGKQNPKGMLKTGTLPRQKYESGAVLRSRDWMRLDDDAEDPMFGAGIRRDRNVVRDSIMGKSGSLRTGKKYERPEEFAGDSSAALPLSSKHDLQAYGRNRDMNKLSEAKMYTSKPPNRTSDDLPKKEKTRANYVQKRGPVSKGSRAFIRNEETESGSSEQFDNDEDSNPLMRSKLAYPTGIIKDSQLSSLKSGVDSKKTKSLKKNSMEDGWTVDGITHFSKKSFREDVHVPGVENYYFKGKQKGKMSESPLLNSTSRLMDEVDRKQVYKLGKSAQLRGEPGNGLHKSSSRVYPTDKRQKGELAYDHSTSQSNYLRDYLVDEEDALPVTLSLADENNPGRNTKKGQSIEAYDRCEKSEASLRGCNKGTKKRKGKEYVAHVDRRGEDGNLQSNLEQQIDDSLFLKKKGKRKLEADISASDMEASEPHGAELGAIDVEIETKPQKKPFILITPTVHTGFSFSIIHLLSAVRLAMITPLPEDSLEVSKPREEQNGKQEGGANGVLSCENAVSNDLDHPVQASVLSLTVHEIVSRVAANPGDPCILETQEPLQDLVRGVLKIFSSKTAPLGAKGWKALVAYEKSTKGWSWVGPVMHSSNDHETIEEVTSPEAWGLPPKMLVKLVDSFANWLKNGQETLQLLGSLPAPPLELMQANLDEKERFRDLRAQKSLSTISPSSEEVRAYFRREELLRYSIPDRAFSYTAADGKKSIVAPLRRCGGKPTSKARDHFMLKRDRPPHVTILCIVRDAAARLPGSIGTRADVCTLIRDSQYIVEEVSDVQVNQVVSGALDRLHYERDPCVQFDGERKLWVYLHREREEEDFEDDGTSSTKKWKRQKKDAAEQPDQGAVTVAFHGTGDQSGDLVSDLNVEPPCCDKKMETDSHNTQNVEDNVDTSHGSEQGNTQQHGHPVQESKLLCQENSTNEDFDQHFSFAGQSPPRG